MPKSEFRILIILAAVQFLAFMDFEMMMPLGTYMATDPGVSASQLGDLVSAYTLAGMVGGLLYTRIADRTEKRGALCWLMAGLALGTLACGLGRNYGHLMAARIIAGFMAGPAGANVFAIVSDLVPEERRGKGIGIVMGGFTASSVLGLPLAIFLADRFGWRPSFIGLAVVAAIVILVARFQLPIIPAHRPSHEADTSLLPPLYRQRSVLLAWFGIAVLMMADFAFVPYLPTYFTANLGIPRSGLGFMYIAGGLTTLFTFQFAGHWTDRFGTFPVFLVSTVAVGLVLYYVLLGAPVHAPLVFGVFALASIFFTNAPRVLAAMTLFTKAPAPAQRGAFMSLQNVIQSGAVGLGSLLSAHLINGKPGQPLQHVGRLVAQNWTGLAVALILVWYLERSLRPLKVADQWT